MRKSLLLLIVLASLGCPPKKTAKVALPGCGSLSASETRSSLEAKSRSLFSEDKNAEAFSSLKRAACYEGTPDPLLLDLAARTTLRLLIQKRAFAREAASLLLTTPGGRDEVIKLAQNANPSVAVALWSALAAQRDESAREPLLALSKEQDPSVRIAALRALLIFDVLSVKDAQEALASELSSMRILGVELAARYQPSLLTPVADDKDTSVRMALVSSLPSLDTEDAALLAGLLATDDDLGVRLSAFELSIQIGVAKEETLAEAMRGSDPLLALSAARIAGPDDPEALKILLAALESSGPTLQNALLLAGSFKIHAKEIAPKLQHVTSSGTPEEQVLAAAALLRVEPELSAGKPSRTATDDAMSTLKAVCDTSGKAAARACSELAPRGDERAKQRLRSLALSDPDPYARAAAIRTLGLFGLSFLNELSACLADENDNVRFTAAQQILKNVGATPKPFGRQ